MSRSPAQRWRLMLGRHADNRLNNLLDGMDQRRDAALDYLYGREYGARGIDHGSGDKTAGSLDPSQLKALDWLRLTRELFPERISERLQGEAIERYGLGELLRDPRLVADLEPTPGLLRALIGLQGRADPALTAEIRRIAREVIDQLMQRIRSQLMRALSGRRNRHARAPMPSAANFDARRTIRANLANWDHERQALIAEHLHFMSRQKRHLDWTIILCVDQSGSMTDSLIFSALIAAVLTSLPGVRVKMVLFDTSVVDVTDQLDDPLDLLLSVQLGGGTDIGRALSYCEGLVTSPTRTILALVSDFSEGASPRRMLATVARLHDAQVRMLGIAALNDRGEASYDRDMGRKLAALGMDVAALTPEGFADWLAEVLR